MNRFTYQMFNAIISAMSRKTNWFLIWNVTKERSVSVYGKNSVARFLRENGCKFNDKRLNLIEGDKAIVFNSRNNSFIVEEAASESDKQ